MKININNSWKSILKSEFEKDYFIALNKFIDNEYSSGIIYPSQENIFSAFDKCSFDELKIVIIGQDPYHGEGQANGLCFSVNDGVKFQPSLRNIFKEMADDVDKTAPIFGNLDYLANQGILLLNATLTVRAKTPGSHQNKGWEQFTDAVIQHISKSKQDVIFILWGAYAQKKGQIINKEKHHILASAHPSPFSVYRGFSGNKHFSKTNAILKKLKIKEIDW